MSALSAEAVARYRRDGFYFPIRALSPEEARGGPLGGLLRQKSHLLFTWLNELIRHPRILDAVEALLGPDLLCWGSSFFNQGGGRSGLRVLAPGLDPSRRAPSRAER
jgi:hypothetical protein